MAVVHKKTEGLNRQDRGTELQGPHTAKWPVRLPDGHYQISRELDRQVRQGSGASAATGDEAHPIFAFLAALGGMGISVAEVCDLCGSSIDHGPVVARTSIRYSRAMRIGASYTVAASIESVTRKTSRRFGAADHVVLQFRLFEDSDDSVCAEVSNTMIMPVARAS